MSHKDINFIFMQACHNIWEIKSLKMFEKERESLCYHLLITALTNYYTNIHKRSTDNFYQVKKFHLSGHISVAKDRCLTHLAQPSSKQSNHKNSASFFSPLRR